MEQGHRPLSTLSPFALLHSVMAHGSEKRVRTDLLSIRLSPAERATIDLSAERAGLTAASYARQTLLGAPAPRQVRRPPVERRELARLLGHFGHIGSNLNQIAKAANSGDGVDSVDLAHALAAVRRMRDEVLRALGRRP